MARKNRYKMSEEHKKKISNALKGRMPKNIKLFKLKANKFKKGYSPWNKGLTKEIDERVLKNSINTGKSLKGKSPWNKGKKGMQVAWNKDKSYEELYGIERAKKMKKEMSKRRKGKHFSPSTEFKIGQRSPRFNKGKGFIDNEGYKAYFFNGKKILEHRLIYMLFNGLENIPKGYVIHHIDGNKLNNHPDNLVLLTISDHTKLHWKQNDIRRVEI